MVDTVAVLPARGGSKRIPRKNIRNFAGKPAIGWAIDAALAAGVFDRIVVSTDDPEIADVARSLGAETPFQRSDKLADDHTGTTDVVRDAVEQLNLCEEAEICCIYPTALFVTAEDLTTGQSLLRRGANWVLAVAEYATPIDRAYRKDGDMLVPRNPGLMPMRSQDLEPAYFDAGQLYWARAKTWMTPDAYVWDGAAAVEIPLERAIDIDTETDWTRAEAAFAHFRSGDE